ncbi:MAG: lipase family protein [Candidatus Ozemobacteraceae bacterium]
MTIVSGFFRHFSAVVPVFDCTKRGIPLTTRRFALLLVLVLTCSVAVQAQTLPTSVQGADCFKTRFNERFDGHDPFNAYLLMLACYYSYENRMYVKDFEEFKTKFQEIFKPLGMTGFDFINLRKKTGDTQVMIMSNDKLVIVVFRGSESSSGGSFSPVKVMYDWILTDFNFFKKHVSIWGSDVKVHRGFWNALDIVYPRLKAFINDHLASGDKKLWITGHSLGAGVAPLAAYRLAFDGIPVQGVYTYAGPRVGNDAFVDVFKERFPYNQRYVFDHDIVPMLPYSWMNYKHTSRPNNIYETGKIIIQDTPFTGKGKVPSHFPGVYLQKLYDTLSSDQKRLLPAPPALQAMDYVPDPALENMFNAERARRPLFHTMGEEDD